MLLVSPHSLRGCRNRKLRYGARYGAAGKRRSAAQCCRHALTPASNTHSTHGEAPTERAGCKHRTIVKRLRGLGVYTMAVGSVCRQAGHRRNRAGCQPGEQFALPSADKASIKGNTRTCALQVVILHSQDLKIAIY